jgi:septum formation protein
MVASEQTRPQHQPPPPQQQLRKQNLNSFCFLFSFFIFIIQLSHQNASSLGLSSWMNGRRLIVGNIHYSHSLIQRMAYSSNPYSSHAAASDTALGNSNNSPYDNPLTNLGLPHPILLGSASFTRKLILQEMNIPFHKLVRPINEREIGDRSQDRPQDLVLMLAHAKMDHLVMELQQRNIAKDELPLRKDDDDDDDDDNNSDDTDGWILLTADQVVTCQGNILEKPESIEEAKLFVQQYGTNPPSTVGSCVLHHVPSNIRVAGVDTATIHFNSTTLTDKTAKVLVETLVELGEPVMSCAGGLMIEHPLVQQHVQRIDGTQDSVMGLSKSLVIKLLQEMSQKLMEQK